MIVDTRYDYGPPAYRGPFTMDPRARLADPEWHESQTRSMQRYHGPAAYTALADPGSYPQWVTSTRGGLVHLVEFVVCSWVPDGYGNSVLFYLVCGQFRSHHRIVGVTAPPEVCHRCHDRHWLKTGEHLAALPQSGCELTRGTAYVTDRTHAIRLKAAA